VLGQDCGDVVPKVCGIVEIFDIGAVDAEDVVDAGCREVLDDVVDHPVVPSHVIT
jgi:hypothetical protein